jgi:hypothetical protein
MYLKLTHSLLVERVDTPLLPDARYKPDLECFQKE